MGLVDAKADGTQDAGAQAEVSAEKVNSSSSRAAVAVAMKERLSSIACWQWDRCS